VKNNILFGLDFDEDKYTSVLTSCDLLSDLQLLSHGDETMIGDRGINLSGNIICL
jgi:ATP-binding cassette, subfamily C (CFTR/MRP), member 2